MAVNSKAKGNVFERKVSKILSERFEQRTGLTASFTRNIDSGSFFGKTNQSRIISHGTEHANFGDILTPSDFKFTVECKHYKTPPSFSAMIKQEFKLFDTWIEQAERDATNANKDWMIVVKFNNVDEFVLLSHKFAGEDAIMRYKDAVMFSLKNILLKEDAYFFA